MAGAGDHAVRFAELVSGPPPSLRLDEACSLMSAAFSGIDRTEWVREQLDTLASQVVEASLRGVLDVMRARLTGNRDDYYDPRNSFIDDVLRRGLGLPISLSVVAIEIGRRVGADILGVGLPGHFIVREAGTDLFGDPFHDGALHDRAGLVAAWDRIIGGGHPFDELHLAPVSDRTVLIRMLNNLRAIFLPSEDGDVIAPYALATMRGGFVELAHEGSQHARWVRALN